MNPFIGVIGFGLSGLMFIIAGIMTLKPIRLTHHPQSWIVLAAACFVLSFLAGYTAYRSSFTANLGLMDIISLILIVIGSGLTLAGIQFLATKALVETRENQELKSELERFRTGFEKVPFIVILKDHQGNYLYTNLVYQNFLGKKGQNLVGESDFKFYPRLQALAFRQEEEKILESGIPTMRDEEIHGVDGVRWIRFSRIPLGENAQGEQTLLN